MTRTPHCSLGLLGYFRISQNQQRLSDLFVSPEFVLLDLEFVVGSQEDKVEVKKY